MGCRYVIKRWEGQICSFLIDEETDRTVEIYADPAPDVQIGGGQRPSRRPLRGGDLVNGQVMHIVKGLQAAFVRIGEEEAYLALEDAISPVYTKKGGAPHLQQGDELLLQVKRSAMKQKRCQVTAKLSLKGRYCILFYGAFRVSVSQKLPEEQREALRREVTGWLGTEAFPYQILLRTACKDLIRKGDLSPLYGELRALEEQLSRILAVAPYRSAGRVLYEEPPEYLTRICQAAAGEITRVVTDDAGIWEEVQRALAGKTPEGTDRENPAAELVRYEDSLLPMEKLYALRQRLEEALQPRVWLKSGAQLVIEHTEAMTVIDVNTAKEVCRTRGEEKEAAVLKTNLAAAREIARQLRLRAISGIILVDFINLQTEDAKAQLLAAFREALARDPVQTTLVDMTRLNLVEITRKKVRPPLREITISFS